MTTVCTPVEARGSIDSCAVAVVALTTAAGVRAPSARPAVERPGPNLATVLPCRKLVKFAVIVTLSDCPGIPKFGLTETTIAAGLIVRLAVFELTNVLPDVVAPLTDTA